MLPYSLGLEPQIYISLILKFQQIPHNYVVSRKAFYLREIAQSNLFSKVNKGLYYLLEFFFFFLIWLDTLTMIRRKIKIYGILFQYFSNIPMKNIWTIRTFWHCMPESKSLRNFHIFLSAALKRIQVGPPISDLCGNM